MSSSSSAVAGPSSAKKQEKKQHKSSKKAGENENFKSNEFIDISASEASDSDSEAGSLDSDADIETIEPRKKANAQTSTGNGSRYSSLPKYAPPAGMSRATVDVNFKDSPFEYEKLASNPSLQLWAIRVPLDLKATRLSSLSIKPPTAAQGPSGSFKHKSTTYNLVSAGQPTASKAVVDKEGRQPTAGPGAADSMDMSDETMRLEGGEEMGGGMRLLVPKARQDGSLFVAPLPISQHLLLEPQISTQALNSGHSAQPVQSYLSQGSSENASQPVALEGVPPSKRPQPVHLLKFRNRAYGFDTPGPIRSVQKSNPTEPEVKAVEAAPSQEKKKKRKSEGKAQPSPRKKSKTSAS